MNPFTILSAVQQDYLRPTSTPSKSSRTRPSATGWRSGSGRTLCYCHGLPQRQSLSTSGQVDDWKEWFQVEFGGSRCWIIAASV